MKINIKNFERKLFNECEEYRNFVTTECSLKPQAALIEILLDDNFVAPTDADFERKKVNSTSYIRFDVPGELFTSIDVYLLEFKREYNKALRNAGINEFNISNIYNVSQYESRDGAFDIKHLKNESDAEFVSRTAKLSKLRKLSTFRDAIVALFIKEKEEELKNETSKLEKEKLKLEKEIAKMQARLSKLNRNSNGDN